MSLGTGNINTHPKKEPSGAPFVAGSAVNGTSINALGRVVLGNDVGANDAVLLNDRQIPLAAFFLQFIDNTGTDTLTIQPSGGGDLFGLRFSDSVFPMDVVFALDALNNRITMRETNLGTSEFFYQPYVTPVFLFTDGGTQGAAGGVVGITIDSQPSGLVIEQFGNPNAPNLIVCNNPNPGAGAFAQFVSDLGTGFHVGDAGSAFGEALLAGQPLMYTNTVAGAFIQLAALGNNSGGFRWFHRIANVITQTMEFLNPGRLGIRVAAPSAAIHLPAGVAPANGAPFKYTAGVLAQTVVENGAKNFDGTNESIAAGGVTYIVKKCLTATANLNFPNAPAQTSQDLTINVPGAAVNDPVTWSVPAVAQVADICITAFVSAANTVTVRLNNYSAGAVDIGAGDYRVTVEKLV